ncbi:MAG: hypothetical protein EU532_01965 [Promethearchaeota archaeon]|nr:MAG: hypothetical protein EU532_01965 [Candidatus Lokiarchaeota archaeon]
MLELSFITSKYLFPITIPLFVAIIILITGRFMENKMLLGSISTIGLMLVIYFSFANFIESMSSPILLEFSTGGTIIAIDSLSAMISLISSILGAIVSLYSIGYFEDKRMTEFYFLHLLMISALNGVAYSGDLVTLFVFTEFLAITAYVLVAFHRNKESIEASFKYIIMGSIGAAFALLALSYVYILAGTTDLTKLNDALNNQPRIMHYFLLIMFLFGFGVKSAIFPVHTWLPDAHSAAPSGVSAMLSGIVIEVELFALIKILVSIFYNRTSSPFDHIITLFLLIIAALTMTIPNLTALVQEDIKRMLAYSSVYNMGLMLVGVAIGTPLALAATAFHILNHGIAKAAIFICAGSFIKEGNTREIKKLMGIGTIMKVTAITFSIAAFFLAAFPPLAMFWSKLFLINATVRSSKQIGWMGIIIAILIVVNSVISIGYYYGILLQNIVIIPENQISENVREASEKSKTIILSEVILLAIMLVVSIMSLFIFDIICHCVNSFISIYS